MDITSKHADSKNTCAARCQVAVPVPIRRGHMQVYDYIAGSAKNCPAGTIVKIPLGGRDVWGILISHDQNEDISLERLKPVISLADVPALTDETMRFLVAVSRWTLAPFGLVMRLMLNTPSALLPSPHQTVYGLSGQLADTTRLTVQRQRVIAVLDSAPPLPLADLAREAGVSSSVVKRLAEDGVLRRTSQLRSLGPETADVSGHPLTKTYQLTSSQQYIADKIDSLAACFGVHLIDGITGSGKTEVYFDQVIKQLTAGRQVVILLPEIALTSSWKARFKKWFGREPFIWHSSVSPARRKIIWRQALLGQSMVVAGARSALFLPFSKLSLIVVDEEHDSSYKQEDQVSYQARDMAIMRAKICNIPVILASATPSLESWIHAGCAAPLPETSLKSEQAALSNWYHWSLTSRYGQAHLPKVKLIDLRLSNPNSGRWLSSELLDAVKARLRAGEQSLLFLNRRGYAPMTVCCSCGHRLTCHQCDSLLVTHKLAGRIQCHFCGIGQPITDTCPACEQTDSLRAVGPGVERLWEELSQLFPDAQIAVLSSDTLQTHEADSLFAAITEGQIDIIIGTQMAAKGHHFPHLTLVGVVDADLGLGGGDLRAAERTYQLLWQVSGRSGRAERPGEVLIQTFQPQHPVMQALMVDPEDNPHKARDKFMRAEAEFRFAAGMPPFGRLAALILSGRDMVKLEQAARHLNDMRPQYDKVDVFGPAQAPLSRVRGQFRIRFLVRADRHVALQKIIGAWLSEAKLPSGVRVACDIDPYSFL